MANIFALIKAGKFARNSFRNWRKLRRAKKAIKEFQKEHGSVPVQESEVFITNEQEETVNKQIYKGKLTYTALAVIVAGTVAQLFGIDVVEGDTQAIVTGIAAIVGVYGRWRANRT